MNSWVVRNGLLTSPPSAVVFTIHQVPIQASPICSGDCFACNIEVMARLWLMARWSAAPLRRSRAALAGWLGLIGRLIPLAGGSTAVTSVPELVLSPSDVPLLGAHVPFRIEEGSKLHSISYRSRWRASSGISSPALLASSSDASSGAPLWILHNLSG